MTLNRRRFLTISAAAIGLATSGARAAPAYVWAGVALGARASIRLDHPEAKAIAARASAEISRLEGIFSLYRADSDLSRLNAEAALASPPAELLECLTLAGTVHRASGGAFDATVQPLWALWAERVSAGSRPTAAELAAARATGGWDGLRLDMDKIAMAPGMGLTLNGIAQGYIADRVAALLEAEGLTDILIDTGEHRALGQMPGGGAWPVKLAQGGSVALRDRALATSAPLGTVFDGEGRFGHILDPRTGEPAAPVWRAVSITAPSAALADALSTAACLMPDRAAIDSLVARFRGAACESAALA
ncbi:FAD:protein FMN transferase [Albidovulum sp.]|uniref:FAD:protein FMN transferase n=1 Tax=Albidovulum sp. TaxID=1872424 RepID=UPI0039B8CA2C